MADVSSWSEMLRWTVAVGRKALPERLLRWAWTDQQVLQLIHTVHFEQWPRFYVRENREPPVLEVVGFNLFNYTPFNLPIVGADLRVSVDGYEWLTYSQRLPSQIPMLAFTRSGFHFARPLTDSQAQKLRKHPFDWIQIRIGGHLVLQSIFGELRKEIHSDIAAIIDRDQCRSSH